MKVLLTLEVSNEIEETVLRAFEIISREAGLKRNIHVKIDDFPNYQLPHDNLNKYNSLEEIFNDPDVLDVTNKININQFIGKFSYVARIAYGGDCNKSYYLFITQNYDLKIKDTNYVIGSSMNSCGAIISLLRITGDNLPRESIQTNMSFNQFENEMIITAILHEFGHVFGCAKKGRIHTIDDILGSHDNPDFIDTCVMLQGEKVPDDWIIITKKRLNRRYAYCSLCRDELKEYFHSRKGR